jgi:hypothetical protein
MHSGSKKIYILLVLIFSTYKVIIDEMNIDEINFKLLPV